VAPAPCQRWQKTEEGKLSSVDCGARPNPKAGWPSLPGGGAVALPGRDGLSRGVWHFPAIPACRKYFLPPFFPHPALTGTVLFGTPA